MLHGTYTFYRGFWTSLLAIMVHHSGPAASFPSSNGLGLQFEPQFESQWLTADYCIALSK